MGYGLEPVIVGFPDLPKREVGRALYSFSPSDYATFMEIVSVYNEYIEINIFELNVRQRSQFDIVLD